MDDLVAFLRARLAETEERVRPYTRADWFRESDLVRQGFEEGDARLIAVHADPARVLREVDAKRRIVDRYARLREHGDTGDAAWVLPLLAAVYVDHPDYRTEWAPDA